MKVERQSKIVELIQKYSIERQEDLSERLKLAGFDVTQATISRDIRELKLTKVPIENGNQKYAIMTSQPQDVTQKLIRVFKEAVISMDYAQNTVVIKTMQGMAMAVGAAIDSIANSEIVGSIAGDDTIFCLTKSEEKAIQLLEKLNQIGRKES